MNKVFGMFLLILAIGAVAWWILKDRAEVESPYAESMLKGLDDAGIQRVQGDFRSIHRGLTSYASVEGAYPQSDWVKAVKPHLGLVPTMDPWGGKYRYEALGEEDYVLSCAGRDREWGTADDIVMETGSLVSH